MIISIKNIITYIAVVMFSVATAMAQDSLAVDKNINKTNNKVVDVDSLLRISELNLKNAPYVALEAAAQARIIVEQDDDSLKLAQTYFALGQCYFQTRVYYLSFEMYFRAYEIFVARNDHDDVAACLVCIAKTYLAQEIFDLSGDYCVKAIELSTEHGCHEEKADALSILGQVCITTDEEFAIPYMEQAKNIYDSLGIVNKSIDINIILAKAYSHLGMPDEALDLLDRNLEEYLLIGEKSNIAFTYLAFGDTYSSMKEASKATTYYNTALKQFYECKLIHDALDCRNRLAYLQYKYGDYNAALDNAKKVLSEAQIEEIAHGSEEIILKHRACNIIYSVYQMQGQTELALKYCEKFAQTGDSIYFMKKKEQYIEFQVSMESQQKQKELEMYKIRAEREKLLVENRMNKRNVVMLVIIILLVVTVVFIYYSRYKEKVKNNTTLALTNTRMEQEIQERKIAEAELRNSEEKYRLLFRKTPVGIVQYSDKFVITAANERFIQIFGLKNKNIVGKDIFTIIPQKAFDGFDFGKIDQSDNSMYKQELKTYTANGDVYVSISVKSFYYNTGVDYEKGGIMIVEDITERKMAEEHSDIYNTTSNSIINMMPEQIYLLDQKANYVFAKIPNMPVAEQYAYIGKNMREVLPPDILLPFLVAFNTVRKTGVPQYAEYQPEDTPTCQIYYEARFMATDNNQVLVIVRDISRQKQAERKLKSAKNTAESGSKAKSEFILGMTSDIKTPLEFILRKCEELVADTNDIAASDKLKEVLNSALFVNETFTDILKLTEVEAGKKKISTRSICPVTLAKDVFDIFKGRAESKNLEYVFNAEPDIPQKLQLDEVRVRQILFNIISNGIKFTEKGSVNFEMSTTTNSDTNINLIFTISDTGIGIADSQIETMFNNENGKTGMALTKKMVDNIKGTLSVESELGKGSVFTFTIPNLSIESDKNDKAKMATAEQIIAAEKATRKRTTDSMREYISVLKYAVIPEYKSLKNEMSFTTLTEFVSKFKEQSAHYKIERGVEIANELITNIQNYDIPNITTNIRKMETYIMSSIKELQGDSA